jgi:hypothetical protein
MGSWQGKFLSLGGRLVLINSSLTNVPLYMLSMYKAPKNILRNMDIFRRRLLWQGGHNIKKYHLADWKLVCSPRGQGGLGVLDLHKMNEALLAKWIWKLENTNGLWQTIIRHKYVKGRPIISLKKDKVILSFGREFLMLGKIFTIIVKKIGNGNSTSFWHNIWCDTEPLSSKFPNLFDITYDKNITVAKAFSSEFRAVNFRRRIYGALEDGYNCLITQCNSFSISEEEDKSDWLLGNKGFSVNSLYKKIKNTQIPVPSSFLWKNRLPYKIKTFLWLVRHNKILTKDNLFKKNWRGNLDCIFCGFSESIDHLFFQCSVARFTWRMVCLALDLTSIPISVDDMFGSWMDRFNNSDKNLALFGCDAVIWAIWRCRNDCCFGSEKINGSTNVIFSYCYWLDTWAIRLKKMERNLVEQGSLKIRKMACEIYNKYCGWKPIDRRIQE